MPDDLPGAPVGEPGRGGGACAVRLTVAVAHSDALLRALLTAPPWHIRAVTPVAAVAAEEKRAPGNVPDRAADGGSEGRGGRGPGSGPAPLPPSDGAEAAGRALPALLRYQAVLLARSQRAGEQGADRACPEGVAPPKCWECAESTHRQAPAPRIPVGG
ncbi:hypothetical protein [Streptomyces sp. ME19-01-6]|uniref:hypothetical protein n=1 Tax=Streptomyces sp. ME19-01-6 TaxID=3028686 RepID=UPI0029A34061|nr:hypothetical protein [Streptomyces sp. ME19-01-6]MDX3231405.1 hypothetical protein [Streptomyces sp. ME19-01-6]